LDVKDEIMRKSEKNGENIILLREGIKELFHRSLRCPMKTIGKKLPHYCALQINQLAS